MLQPERSPAGGQLPAVPAGPLGGCSREPRGTGRLFQRGEYCIIISYSILPSAHSRREKSAPIVVFFQDLSELKNVQSFAISQSVPSLFSDFFNTASAYLRTYFYNNYTV